MQYAKKNITLVAAMSTNRVIGLKGKMPWHLPGELQHFKAVTMGKPIVMGRKTWESIGRVLPGRQNIVVSRNSKYEAGDCLVCTSLEHAVDVALGAEVMVIGGGELYRQALPMASRMILTLVDCVSEGDTWFPNWEPSDWTVKTQRTVPASETKVLSYQVRELVRTWPW